MTDLVDESNSKKNLTNIISYSINKKMTPYNIKLDNITKKFENNMNMMVSIIEILKKIEHKIDKLEKNVLPISRSSSKNNIDDIIMCSDEFSNLNINILNELVKNEIIKNESIKNEPVKNEPVKNDIPNLLDTSYKDFKPQTFILDTEVVKNCLNMNNINGDIKLFKKLYIDNIPKEYYPIRHIKKKFQYWCNGHMNDDDSNGTYIKNIIIKNIEQCYLRINNDENYENDIEQFLRNQEHINKLSEQKYKDKILAKVITIIDL